MRRTKLLVVALAVSQLTCNQALLTAPPASTLVLFANPLFISANGGISVVSAIVVEPAGTPVPDGTVVQFFTTLGRIDEQGRTNDGVARVNLVGEARSGDAVLTAFSGINMSGTVTVKIGSVLPDHLFVTANPSQITDSRSTHIFANVFDERGDPVPNVPVIFSVDGSLEFMDSAGRPIFTDNNGRAEDVMRTRYQFGLPPRTVLVSATTSNGKTDSVAVVINPVGAPAPAPSPSPSP